MAKKSVRGTRKRTSSRKEARRASRKSAAHRTQAPHTRSLIARVVEPATRERAPGRRAAAAEVPEARIARGGGTVNVEITFGHAQHGAYTIQLFDPTGITELARETGFSTDTTPDRFDLKLTPSRLDGHFVQWSGAVDAFSSAPGQRFSVIFEVTQDGASVPGGRVEKPGPLNITQAFLGVLRLVAS